MSTQNQYQCRCAACQSAQSNPTKSAHKLMNHFLATLDDGRRRFYVGLEAVKRGHGSEKGLALIIGWTEAAIHEARKEVESLRTSLEGPLLPSSAPSGDEVALDDGVSAATGRASVNTSGLPTGLPIDAPSGQASGTVDNSADAGNLYVGTATATDGLGTVSQSFRWEVRKGR